MSEYFRRVIIKFFLKKKLISAELATSLINWRHSGFSVNASVRIPAGSAKTREALSQYIARPPLSLKKISITEKSEATVISYTSDNDFFNAIDQGMQLTGMRYLEIGRSYPGTLPQNNVVGYDDIASTAGGYRNLTISNSLYTGNVTAGPWFVTWDYGGGTLVRGAPAAGEVSSLHRPSAGIHEDRQRTGPLPVFVFAAA